MIDADKVEWNVHIEERKNLEIVNTIPLKTHRCGTEDFDKFYPISEDQSKIYANLRAKESLFCINKEEILKIQGHDEIDSIALNVDYIACRTCKGSQSSLQKYLNHPELVIMYNT